MLNKRIMIVLITVLSLLMIPLILQLTIGTGIDGQGFNWGLEDFVAIGILLLCTGLAIEYVTRKITNPTRRVISVIIIVIILLFIWAHLAVGLVDSWPFAGS